MLVSVSLITYNHDKYISKAIEGVLTQVGDFKIELVIGDDNSTDNTTQIISKFKKENTEIIRPILRVQNIGPSKNAIDVLTKCKGKYIAMLEGDDYWTDPYKLQKQIRFLENNPEFILTSHRYREYDMDKKEFKKDKYSHLFKNGSDGIEIDREIFFKYWLTKTLSVVFRNQYLDFKVFNKYAHFRDVHLFYHLLVNGKGYCHNFIGGVYNIHSNGIWGNQSSLHRVKNSYLVLNELYNDFPSDSLLKVSLTGTLRRYIVNLIDCKKKPYDLKELLILDYKYLKLSNNWKLSLIYLFKIFKKMIQCIFQY